MATAWHTNNSLVRVQVCVCLVNHFFCCVSSKLFLFCFFFFWFSHRIEMVFAIVWGLAASLDWIGRAIHHDRMNERLHFSLFFFLPFACFFFFRLYCYLCLEFLEMKSAWSCILLVCLIIIIQCSICLYTYTEKKNTRSLAPLKCTVVPPNHST